MDDRRRAAIVVFIVIAFPCLHADTQTAAVTRNSKRVVVTVNGTDITEADLNFIILSRRIPAELARAQRKQLIEQLIDRRVLLQFLVKRKVKPPKTAVDSQIRRIIELIRRTGDDPDKVLAKLGYTQQKLRTELGFPLMWKSYALSLITRDQLRDHWKKHKIEFDGTQLRASHIVMKIGDPTDKSQVADVTEKLNQIRSDIIGKKITFANAAMQFSQSPTKERGGDLGFFPFRGKMPVSISRVIFALGNSEISKPFQTKYGLHIAIITGRRPGQLSLEDTRPDVFEQLAENLRKRLIRVERAKSRIHWNKETE